VSSVPSTARRFVQIEDDIHLVLLLSADVVEVLEAGLLEDAGCMSAFGEK